MTLNPQGFLDPSSMARNNRATQQPPLIITARPFITTQLSLAGDVLTTSGPAFVQLLRMGSNTDPSGGAPGNGLALCLAATASDEPVPAGNVRPTRAKRFVGQGNGIFLPYAGKWKLYNNAGSGWGAGVFRIIENFPVELAQRYLEGNTESYYNSSITCNAAGSSSQPLTANANAGQQFGWTYLAVRNTDAVSSVDIVFGNSAIVAPAAIRIAPLGQRDWSGQWLMGASVNVISSDAGTPILAYQGAFAFTNIT